MSRLDHDDGTEATTMYAPFYIFINVNVYLKQNICKPKIRHSKRRNEYSNGWQGKTPYALSLPVPPLTTIGWPATSEFVTVNES